MKEIIISIIFNEGIVILRVLYIYFCIFNQCYETQIGQSDRDPKEKVVRFRILDHT